MDFLKKLFSFKNSIKIDVLVTQETAGDREMWVAQCLQYDIVAQGKSFDEMMESFCKIMFANYMLAKKNNIKPFSNFSRAPQQYWDEYNQIQTKLAPRPEKGRCMPEPARELLESASLKIAPA